MKYSQDFLATKYDNVNEMKGIIISELFNEFVNLGQLHLLFGTCNLL